MDIQNCYLKVSSGSRGGLSSEPGGSWSGRHGPCPTPRPPEQSHQCLQSVFQAVPGEQRPAAVEVHTAARLQTSRRQSPRQLSCNISRIFKDNLLQRVLARHIPEKRENASPLSAEQSASFSGPRSASRQTWRSRPGLGARSRSRKRLDLGDHNQVADCQKPRSV